MCNDHFELRQPSVEPLTHGRIVPIGSPRQGLRVGLASCSLMCNATARRKMRHISASCSKMLRKAGCLRLQSVSRSPSENRWQSAHPLRDFESRKRGHCASDEHRQPEGAEVFEIHPDHVLFFQIDDMPSGSSSPLRVERPLTDEEMGTSKAFPEVKGDGAMAEYATDSSDEEYQIPQLFFCQQKGVGEMVGATPSEVDGEPCH